MSAIVGQPYTITFNGQPTPGCLYLGNDGGADIYQVPDGNTNGHAVDLYIWLTWAILNGRAKAASSWAASAGLHAWYSDQLSHGLFNKIAPEIILAITVLAVTYGFGAAAAGGGAAAGAGGGSAATSGEVSTAELAPTSADTLAPITSDPALLSDTIMTIPDVAEGATVAGTLATGASVVSKASTVESLLQTGTKLVGVAAAVTAAKAKAAAPAMSPPPAPAKPSPVVAAVLALVGLLSLGALVALT